jgi:hypothetical protein
MTNLTAQAVALHVRHPSWHSGEIARAIGSTPKYVRKVLLRHGFRITNPRRRFLPDWERQAVIDAYVAGEKVWAIAVEFGVLEQCVRRAARKAGFPPRTGNERWAA